MTENKENIIKVRKELLSKLKKKNVTFRRQNFWRFKRLKKTWRKPRGRTGKVRLKKGGRVPSPGPGYGNPSIIKHLHPSGYEEVYVSCSKDMAEIDAKTQAIRFNGTLGKKKKEVLLKDAEKAGIKVLNP
jgi:large subunit ribosomal protein L32e